MKKLWQRLSLLGTTGILLLGSAGCTPRARQARLLARAGRDFDAGRTSAAEIEYLKVLRDDGHNPAAIGRLGILYFDEGRLENALTLLLEARRLEPDDAATRITLGLCFLALGKFSEAKAEAEHVLDRRPDDPDAPLLLAEASVRPPEIEEARRRLQRLPGLAGGRAPVLVALGTLDFRLRHFAPAEDFFKRALAADPGFSAAFTALGALYWAKGDLPAADRAFAKAAELEPASAAKRLQQAQFKIQTGDPGAGRRILTEIAEKNSDFLPARVALAELDEAEKKYGESADMIGKVLAQDPLSSDALLLSGRLQLAQGRAAGAVAELEKAEKIYPHYPQLEYELGRAYLAAGEIENAAACLNRAVAWNPDFSDAVLLAAKVSLQRDDPESAIVGLRPLIQKRPDLTEARFLLAEADSDQNNLDDALGEYRRLATDFPRDPRPLTLSGAILLRQNRPEDARRDFDRALERDPDYFPALRAEVDLDLAEKRYAAARRRVDDLIARKSALPGSYVLLGEIFLAQRAWPQAEDALQTALRLQPDSTAASLLLAEMDTLTGRDREALANLRQVTEKRPPEIGALMLLAAIESREKDFAAAREAYEKILALQPDFGPALNNLADLCSNDLGQPDRALALAQRARKLLPNDPRVADTLGWILYQKHHYAWAVNLLQESADGLPAAAEIQFHLGMARYMLGEETPARTALQRALALGGDFAGSAEARRRLAVLAIDAATTGPEERAVLAKAAADWPDDPIALSRLIDLYQRQGEGDRARAAGAAALRRDPGNAALTLRLARLYAAGGDTAAAFALAKSARNLAPDDPATALLLGRLAYSMKDYTWAASLLQEAAARRPDDPAAAYGYAQAGYSLGRVSAAVAAMRRALAADPRFAQAGEARRFLEWTDIPEPPPAAAAARAGRLLQTEPAYVPALMVRARAAEADGQPAAARQAYEKVLEIYPGFSPAKKRLVIVRAENPDDQTGLVDLAVQAREAFPGDPQVAKACGIIAYRQGAYARAAGLLSEAAAQSDGDGELMFYLGMAQCRLKDKSGRETLERALDLNLKGDLAAEAKRALAALK